MAKARIGLREVRSLAKGATLWDLAVPGFGVRRQRGDAVAYILFYRTTEGRQRLFTIGRHGAPWTPDEARQEAKRLLGKVVQGEDPASDKRAGRNAKSVAELCDFYLADAEVGRLLTRRKEPKKSSTLATDRGRIERHIKPLLGSLSVGAVTSFDVEQFMHAVARGETAGRTRTKSRGVANVRGGKGTASRTVGLLGGIFSYAVHHRLRVDNPVRGVTRFADGRRERRLTIEEYANIGNALRMADSQGEWPAGIAAARFLAFTGWRSGEVLNLRWSDIDLLRRTAYLQDTKTGRSTRALSNRACGLLRPLPRLSTFVFAAARGNGPMSGFPKTWHRIVTKCGVPPDVTPHVLRHSYASLAADLGNSESTIAMLIGHKGRTMTSRYVHSADAVLLATADAVSEHIAQLLGDSTPDRVVVPLRREMM